MAIITTQHVHDRTWAKCPRCDGGSLFTPRERAQGAICTYCEGTGHVARHVDRKPVDNSSFYERQAGA